jgi:N-acetylglutamate synthase/N-acetylornithine aminotransferase
VPGSKEETSECKGIENDDEHRLDRSSCQAGAAAATAVLTTDTHAKQALVTLDAMGCQKDIVAQI